MHRADRTSRRRLLQQLFVAVPLAAVTVSTGRAADEPLLAPDSPEAKALGYVEDAKAASSAAGHHCGDCALFQGASGAAQGPCQLFAGKQVKTAGWCRSWAPQM